MFFFFSSRRRHTRWPRDWSSDVCSSDLAFDEVGDILNRTSAACGFRWNAEVRSKYVDAIELAKRQRKEKKRQKIGRASCRERVENKVHEEEKKKNNK